jgi:hypothetical protein
MSASKARRARKARRRMALAGGAVTVCQVCGERLRDPAEPAAGPSGSGARRP